MATKQTLILLLLSVVCGLGLNLLSPRSIDFIGAYRELSTGDGPVVPPAAQAGDPPFIDINVAQMEYVAGRPLFIDCRDSEEFMCGTIPGSINIPFEYLPDDLDAYYDSVFQDISKDTPMILFCSGEECDLSLHLGRNLQDYDFTSISIFFGGSREWEKFGLKMERRKVCD